MNDKPTNAERALMVKMSERFGQSGCHPALTRGGSKKCYHCQTPVERWPATGFLWVPSSNGRGRAIGPTHPEYEAVLQSGTHEVWPGPLPLGGGGAVPTG